MWSACGSDISSKVSSVADGVSDQLGSLAAKLRVQGARVGVGEVLAAHRSLAAVDCSSREDSRLALRAVMCAGKDDLERFDRAFAAVFGDGLRFGMRSPFEDLDPIAKAAIPRAGIPGSA